MIRDLINSNARRVPKWLIYVLGVVPFAGLIWQLFNGGLGIDPVKSLEHELGEIGLQFMIAGLAITPLLKNLRINLVKFRRPIGLLTFFYITMHLLVWLLLDMQLLWPEIVKDLYKRWYIIIGMAAFVLMIPLAITSNDWSLRKMGGEAWRRLHKIVYGAALLGALHFVILVKGFQVEPLIYMAVVLTLLALRLPRLQRMRLA